MLNTDDKQIIASNLLKEEFALAKTLNKTSISLKSSHGKRLELPTPQKVTSKFDIPEDLFPEIMRELRMSQNGVMKLVEIFKRKTKLKMPSYIRKKLYDMEHAFDELFEVVPMEFHCKVSSN